MRVGTSAVADTAAASVRVLLFAVVGLTAVAALRAASQPTTRALAFERDGAVWLAAPDGSGAIRITAGVDPCISPDGRSIAYTEDTSPTRGGVRRHIAVVDVATKASRVFKSVPGDNAFGPVWSPDGSSLLVNVLAGGEWSIGLVRADETSFRYVHKPAAGGHSFWSAVFAPDGHSIFCQDLDNLMRLGLDGGLLWQASVAALIPAGSLNSNARLAPTPDGKGLLVDVDMDEDTTMEGWDGPPPAVFLVDIAAKTAKRLTPKGLFAWDPTWLDAATFLCITMHEGDKGPSIVRMALAGGAPTLLVRDARTPTVSSAPAR